MGKARNETQPSRMGDAFNAGRRETRIPSRGAPGGIRRPGRIVGLHGWRVGPIVLSEEKAVEAMHRLAGPSQDVDGDDDHSF